MKHLTHILAVAMALLVAACSGEEENEYYPAKPGSLTLRLSTTNVMLPSTGASAEISVESNSRWTVADTGDNSWLTITYTSEPKGTANGTFTITAANNLSGAQRTTTVTVTSAEKSESITVTQSATSMAVDPTRLAVFPAEGGSETIHILSSTKWSATTVADWISLTPSTGEASDEIADVTVTVAPTTLETQRTSEILIECSDDPTIEPVHIAVSQRGLDPEQTWFEVNPTAVPEIGYAGDSFNVTVRSSSACKVSSIADWIDFKGSENIPASDKPQTFKVTVKANPDEVVRESTLTIKSENPEFEPISITIRQQAKPAAPLFFEVNPTSLPVMQAAGGTATISVRCNAAWNVATAANWLTLSATSGAGGETAQSITVTASTNEYATSREATLTFTSSDRRSQPIAVTLKQAAADAPTVGELSASGISLNSATLSCALNAPTRITEKGVMYRAAGSGADWTKVADTSAATDRITATVTGLRPGIRYEAKAYCRATSGQAETAVITFRTSGTTPGADDNTPPNR